MQKSTKRIPHILFLDVNITNSIGGGQYFASRLISALNSKFHFTIASGLYTFYLQEQIKNCNVLLPGKLIMLLALILQHIYALKNRKVIILLASGFFLVYIYLFSREIKRSNELYDLVLTGDGYYQGEVITLISKLKREPIIHMLLSSEPLDLTGVPFFRLLSIKLLRFVAHSRNLFFIALNKYVAEDFLKVFPQHVIQIGAGVETDKYSPVEFDSKQNIILYVGRLDEGQKNISLLIKAFANLRNTSYSLLIVGDGKDREFYLDMINKFDIAEKCKLMGFVSEREKIGLLSKSKIFVNPSTREGQSSAVLEAMSSGCAVICVDNNGARDTIINGLNGTIIDNDVNSLKMALENLILNEGKIKELSSNARNWVLKNYSISIIAQKYQRLFNNIMGENCETI